MRYARRGRAWRQCRQRNGTNLKRRRYVRVASDGERLDPTGRFLQRWDHRPANPDDPADPPQQVYDYFSIASLTVNGLDGDDALVFDFTNGAFSFRTNTEFDGGAGTDTLTVLGTPYQDSFIRYGADAPYWLADSVQVWYWPGYYNDAIIHHTDVENTLFEGNGASDREYDGYSFGPCTWVVDTDLTVNSPDLMLDVGDGVDVTLAASQNGIWFYFPGTDGQVHLSGEGTTVSLDYMIAIGGDWLLDVGDASLVVNSIPAHFGPDYRALLAAVYDGGLWDGLGGLTSSLAAGDPSGLVGVGWASAASLLGLSGADTATWRGQTVDVNSYLVRATYNGDMNLDGVVDQADIDLWNAAVASDSPATWQTGDFNYDGVRDSADYAMMMNAYANQGAPL